jgi:hypothetical protein
VDELRQRGAGLEGRYEGAIERCQRSLASRPQDDRRRQGDVRPIVGLLRLTHRGVDIAILRDHVDPALEDGDDRRRIEQGSPKFREATPEPVGEVGWRGHLGVEHLCFEDRLDAIVPGPKLDSPIPFGKPEAAPGRDKVPTNRTRLRGDRQEPDPEDDLVLLAEQRALLLHAEEPGIEVKDGTDTKHVGRPRPPPT